MPNNYFGRVENTEPYSLSWFSPRTDLKLRPLEVKIFEKMNKKTQKALPFEARSAVAESMFKLANYRFEEIKKVYRVKRKEFHPDALISKGLPEELIEKAKEKFIEIQAAFEIIEKEKK